MQVEGPGGGPRVRSSANSARAVTFSGGYWDTASPQKMQWWPATCEVFPARQSTDVGPSPLGLAGLLDEARVGCQYFLGMGALPVV